MLKWPPCVLFRPRRERSIRDSFYKPYLRMQIFIDDNRDYHEQSNGRLCQSKYRWPATYFTSGWFIYDVKLGSNLIIWTQEVNLFNSVNKLMDELKNF